MKAIIRKDEEAVSPVIATILMVAITVVLAAVLYVMVSGLITSPGTSKPTVALGTATLVGSFKNESIPVASASQSVAPTNYKVNLLFGSTTGVAVAAPATSGAGGQVSVVVGANTYKIAWTDIGGEGTVNGGDSFTVTFWGSTNVQATMPSGSYTFFLLWSDGSQITSQTFSVS